MRKLFILFCLILFFCGGFYLGWKSRESQINSLKEKLEETQKILSQKRKEFKSQIDLLKKEWAERKKEIDKLEEKIENFFKKFSKFTESGKPEEKRTK
ncbi:MAG: hypothetical protein DRP67_05200 [Candidatus Omnitrophota bacterium]|nr:MAG: hypothetical protein DRP67_05200 [Candidatus Omnitrophota bacterium]